METSAHSMLKRLAATFIYRAGCRAVATEVRCPFSHYRVDVAGYQDPPPRRRRAEPRGAPSTVVVECKQCRADFLRDCHERERLLAQRRQLERLRRHIEERRIKVHEPHLRVSGSALFPELEEWDFAASRVHGYRQVIRRIGQLERKLYGQTKFFTIARYRLADRLFLAAPYGMIRRSELPPGWGLLECPTRWLRPDAFCRRADTGALRLTVEPTSRPAPTEYRQRLLRNIAVAASRRPWPIEADPEHA